MKTLASFTLCLCVCAGLLLFGDFAQWETSLLLLLLIGEGGYQLSRLAQTSTEKEQVILNRIATTRALRVWGHV